MTAKRKPGRPPIDPALRKRQACYKMHPWLLAWLRAQNRPATQLIEDALVGWYRIDHPKSND